MGELLEALKGITLPQGAEKVIREADAIYSKRTETASYVDHLETQIKKLESEVQNLQRQKGVIKAYDHLDFNETTGTYVERATGLHYCTKCLADDKRQPLQKDARGWKCHVCGKYFHDPSAPPPRVVRGRGGPGGWMG